MSGPTSRPASVSKVLDAIEAFERAISVRLDLLRVQEEERRARERRRARSWFLLLVCLGSCIAFALAWQAPLR